MRTIAIITLLALVACAKQPPTCAERKAQKDEILSRSETEPITEDDVTAVQEHFELCVMNRETETYEHYFEHNGEMYTCIGTTKECIDIAERCRTGKQMCPPATSESNDASVL